MSDVKSLEEELEAALKVFHDVAGQGAVFLPGMRWLSMPPFIFYRGLDENDKIQLVPIIVEEVTRDTEWTELHSQLDALQEHVGAARWIVWVNVALMEESEAENPPAPGALYERFEDGDETVQQIVVGMAVHVDNPDKALTKVHKIVVEDGALVEWGEPINSDERELIDVGGLAEALAEYLAV